MVSVQPPRGFVDRNDEFVRLKDRLLETLAAGYERYGFPLWESSSVERLDALLGGGESEAVKQIFYVRSPDDGQMNLGLRFDLTIPFARVAAALIQTGHPLPLRRAEAGLVDRADKPGPGRVRQFTQFDVDILGSPSPWAELEILSALHFALGEGFGNVVGKDSFNIYTKVSSRRLLDDLLIGTGLDDLAHRQATIRVIDKMDKLKPDELFLELTSGRIDEESEAEVPGIGLPKSIAERIIERTNELRKHASRRATLEAVSAHVASTRGQAAIQELADFDSALNAVGLSDEQVEFDLSLARGLDYYTGLVFEVRNRVSEGSSIAGGGRYDNLLARFSNVAASGTGISIGVDRIVGDLIAARQAADAGSSPPLSTRRILLGLPGINPADLQGVANYLRKRGVSIELHIPEAGTSLRKQLAYANRGGYAYAVVVGADELRDGTVSVKDLRRDTRDDAGLSRDEYRTQGTGWQETISLEQAAAAMAVSEND